MKVSERSPPSQQSTSEPESVAVLRAENERLIALLEANGIKWRLAPEPTTSPLQTESSALRWDMIPLSCGGSASTRR